MPTPEGSPQCSDEGTKESTTLQLQSLPPPPHHAEVSTLKEISEIAHLTTYPAETRILLIQGLLLTLRQRRAPKHAGQNPHQKHQDSRDPNGPQHRELKNEHGATACLCGSDPNAATKHPAARPLPPNIQHRMVQQRLKKPKPQTPPQKQPALAAGHGPAYGARQVNISETHNFRDL